MPIGVYRRPFWARRRLHAVATLTAPSAVTTSLPLVRRRPPYNVYRRFYPLIPRRLRSIAGLPNADPVVSLPMVRRRPPYSVYLTPPPPIVRLRRMVIGLPNADDVAVGSLLQVRFRAPYSLYRLPYPRIVRRRAQLIIGLPCADDVPSKLISIIIFPDLEPCP